MDKQSIMYEGKALGSVSKQKELSRVVIVAVLFIGFWLVFLQTPTVEAHSSLLETVPEERVVTDSPPSSLKLRFNEPIEQDLANVTVYDWNANPVFTGQPDGDRERSELLEFSLPEMEEGTYTVNWSVVSLDGHPVSGSYIFAVGEATEGGTKSVDESDDSSAFLIAARTLVEGLLLIGAGLYWFAWLAQKRQFPGFGMLRKTGRRTGAILLIAGTIAEFVAYITSLPAGLFQTMMDGRWDLILHFPFLMMLVVQLFFLILLIIPGMVQGWYLALWFLLAITPSFGGHVWGMELPFVGLVPRIVHQLAVALWLGGLSYLILLLIWNRKQHTDTSFKLFRPFFVRRMMVATGLVVLSGVTMVFLQTSWTAVVTEWVSWSSLLFIKIVFTILMLSLALFQTLKWKKQKGFFTSRIVRVEWVIGLTVIFAGVWMSQINYPIAVQSYDNTLITEQAEADVHIDNLQTGEQQMHIDISPLEGENPERVTVDISMPDHGMSSGPFEAEKVDSDYYQVDLPFSMSGSWHVSIRAEYEEEEVKEWEDDVFITTSDDNS
ncbi:copper resistance protein CopC [Virgibacillus sp. NKC19-3]|uniref:copper resistance protein CopC n=1 Tax=Virgibacillus saliphilus TaxID=2831674 RepID=UPI001C9B645F|nr:copper resistance protein CopC [Virgibacillus sp. NKC19-3]MBY7145065.1 copper resistance protein CopC [Virgibacillus sp. NKC19-3]